VYGDLCSLEARSFALTRTGTAHGDALAFRWPEQIVSFGLGPTGELYGLGAFGRVFRVDPGWSTASDMDQSVRPPEGPPDPEPSRRVDCGVIDALVPLTYLGSLSPKKLHAALDRLDRELAGVMPNLPADLRDAARIVRTAFQSLNAQLASTGWDLASPTLAGVREDMLNVTGEFQGFGEALGALYASPCK
jgi:hypothetical protein